TLRCGASRATLRATLARSWLRPTRTLRCGAGRATLRATLARSWLRPTRTLRCGAGRATLRATLARSWLRRTSSGSGALACAQLLLCGSSHGGARRRVAESTLLARSKGGWRWNTGCRADCLVRLPNRCLARNLTAEILAPQFVRANLHRASDFGRASEDPRLDIEGFNGAAHLGSNNRRCNASIHGKVALANQNRAIHHDRLAQQNRLWSNNEYRNPRCQEMWWLDENPEPRLVPDFDDDLIRR